MLANLNTLVLLSVAMAALPAQIASAATIQFNLSGNAGVGLLPGNENQLTQSSGTGGELGQGIAFDDETNILSLDFGWGEDFGFEALTGPATVGHIHGPADQLNNAGVVFDLLGRGPLTNIDRVDVSFIDNGATGGRVTGTVQYNATEATDLLAGLHYINIHSAANPAGELRGQLIPVPEASAISTIGLAVLGGLGIALSRRSRQTEVKS